MRPVSAAVYCRQILTLCLLLAHSTGSYSEAKLATSAPQAPPNATFSFKAQHAPPDLSNWDYVGRWGNQSTVSLLPASETMPQATWRCLADRKRERVGKAYVTKNFPPAQAGDIIEVEARYLITRAPSDGSLYLMDIECRHCGPQWKAGIRVLVRQGQLRVNRSKLALKKDLVAKDAISIPTGKSFALSTRLRLGDESGETVISIDGSPVIQGRGVNMPLRHIFAQQNLDLKEEHLDYVQFGITANSGDSEAEVLVSDIELSVFK